MIYRPSRRDLIRTALGGIGYAGLTAVLGSPQQAAAFTSAVPLGHYTGPRTNGRAKHVISLFLSGGPSHVDMFDPKPALVKYAG